MSGIPACRSHVFSIIVGVAPPLCLRCLRDGKSAGPRSRTAAATSRRTPLGARRPAGRPTLDILLATINARHAHSSLSLRCLYANLGPLASRARIVEFVSGARIESMLERLLAMQPRIVALSVYVWNVAESTRLVAMLRAVAPAIKVVLGGPEVSHETAGQPIVALADHVITGPGERAFARLARQLLDGPVPLMKIIAGDTPGIEALNELASPYPWYSDHDIAHRHLYIEASRGCPFKCEFCLSSLDKTAWPFDTTRLLGELRTLHMRGARTFKFIDRTFNLNVAAARRILEFFLEADEAAPDDPTFAHFELVPDHLPAALRDTIARFAAGRLQFEIGVQTWNPEVQARISRRQHNERAEDNLRWLLAHTRAHLHVDLIVGLPGEDLASFGRGFDRLCAIGPHEIQVGILKRLRGTPIARHTEPFGLRFNPEPPYNLLASADLSFFDMQRMNRFARYWDLIGNSGRFVATLPIITGDSPFARFLELSDWLYDRTDATHRIALDRLYQLVRQWLREQGLGADGEERIDRDRAASGLKNAAGDGSLLPRQARFLRAPAS